MTTQKNTRESLIKCIGEKVCANKTPFFDLRDEPLKTISFDWDRGGWNNVRMGLETMVCIAKLFNRALVLPPPQEWYLLNEKAHMFEFYDEETFKSFIPVYTKQKKGNTWIPSKDTQICDFGQVDLDLLKKHQEYDHWHFPKETRMFTYFPLGFPRPNRFFSLIKSAFRIKQHLIDEACDKLVEHDLELGKYVALHIRKNDFQFIKVTNRPAEDILKYVTDNIPKNIPILILTDEYDDEIIGLFEKAGHRVVCWAQKKEDAKVIMRKKNKNFMKTNSKESIVIDMICGVPAKRFFGSQRSTLSTYIVHMRGQLHTLEPEIDPRILYTCPQDTGRDISWWSFIDKNYWERNPLKIIVNYVERTKEKINLEKGRKRHERNMKARALRLANKSNKE